MTAIRICKSCNHESDLLEASPYCCGNRDIRAVWECSECSKRASRKAEGWRADYGRHLCGECAPVTTKTRRVKTKKKQAGTPGGLF